ncbi:MAG: TIGR03619 family F420-dependent LLM class oxidoreductase [Nocardioides sp.]|uniref:TIGR03619 family F420-dependent LLM class oxidoreductase n=1 Tax=Nocardioides sp. TaxID=35761 RepID=UPI003EFFFD11
MTSLPSGSPSFAVVTAFLPVEQIGPIAEAADRLGYRSLSVADHVVDLETLTTPYPYRGDGKRRWESDVDWPDPWVLIGALSSRTTRLRFFTSIYVAALRSPYTVAKAVGTASVISDGRVSLGVGVGWCRDEFELLGQEFSTRGARTDDALALMRELWSPGWSEHDGPHYPTPRLTMNPVPRHPVPILVGGLSEVALRRAARHDGWVGDVHTVDEAVAISTRLRELRAEQEIDGPFEVVPALSDALLPEDFARAGAAGVTEVMTAPWMYYSGRHATLEEKLEGMERFRDDVMVPLGH